MADETTSVDASKEAVASKENAAVKEETELEAPKAEPNFAVGLRVFLELAQDIKHMRTDAEVLGWRRGSLLMITVPLHDNRPVIALPGAKIIMRYILEGVAYGFATRLSAKLQNPLPMWVLEYPTDVETRNLRRSPRVALSIPMRDAATGAEFVTVDLSAHGVLLVCKDPLTMGQKLELSFHLPNGEEIERLEGEVVRLQTSREISMAGVNFNEKDDLERNRIATCLYGKPLK